MICPACGHQHSTDFALFCNQCGMKLPRAVKEALRQELKSALSESPSVSTPSLPSLPACPSSTSTSDHLRETDALPDSPDDAKKAEYKRFLKEILADGQVSADEMVVLAHKIRRLGLDRNEALNIQADVARELNLSIEEEGELFAGDIVVEINTNKSYCAGDMDNLELRMTNRSDEVLARLSVSRYLLNLKETTDKLVGTLSPEQKKIVYMPFSPSRSGNEIVELTVSYCDPQGNPSIYRSEFPVRVLTKEEEMRGAKSISISFNGNRILGSDLSNMAHMLEEEKPRAAEKRSSYLEDKKTWRRLALFFDEEATNRERFEIVIQQRRKAGEENLSEARRLRQSVEGRDKAAADEAYEKAYDCLVEAMECFEKIRELDPDHREALGQICEIKREIAEIEHVRGARSKAPAEPAVQISSGMLTIPEMNKKIVIHSKDRVVIGRDSKCDIVLRVMPCLPKEKHPENYKKSCQISGVHAEIVNRHGVFYLRDTGSSNVGSTNGTFVEGKRLQPLEDCLLRDGMRINIAKVLELECIFIGESKQKAAENESLGACYTVLGEVSDSCFGIDKKGIVNAIKFRRRSNYTDEEKYIILIRETTIGRSAGNGIVLDHPTVSDIHAKIFYRDNRYWIEDLNSRHGTRVNGKVLPPWGEVSLGTQSEIMVGDVTMIFGGWQ